MTDEEIIEFLTENLYYFVTNDLVGGILRGIGWLLVQGLNALIDACKTLYNHTFALVDITRWTGLESFIEEYDPLVKAFLMISLVVLGYMFVFGKQKKNDLIMSALIFAVVLTSSSYLFTTFNSWAVLFKDAVVGDDSTASGYELVNQNLYDLIYIDEQLDGLDNMTSDEKPPQYEELTEDDVRLIDITETLPNDKDGLTDNAKDILSKRLEYRNDESALIDVYNGVAWTDFANTYYYRYKFDFGSYYLSAIAAIIVFLGVSYKNVRVVYELFVSRILVTIFSADMSSKRKAVRLLESIRDGYYALCFTAITLRSYFLFNDYLTDQANIGSIVRGIILLFIAWCVVDGANIMEKITGVDAGLTTMAGKLIAGMHMARGVTQTVQQARQFGMMKRQTKAMQAMAGQKQEAMEKGASGSNGSMPDGQAGESANGVNVNEADNGSGTSGYGNMDGQDGTGANRQEDGFGNGPTANMDADAANYSDSSGQDVGVEQASGSFTDTSDGADAADRHFAEMDDALDRQNDNGGDNGHGMQRGSDFGEKGMFEKWEEKTAANRPGGTDRADIGQNRPGAEPVSDRYSGSGNPSGKEQGMNGSVTNTSIQSNRNAQGSMKIRDKMSRQDDGKKGGK